MRRLARSLKRSVTGITRQGFDLAVYEALRRSALAIALLATQAGAFAQDDPAALALAGREAFQKRDQARLAALNASAQDQRHPLAPWFDYWALNLRLPQATQADLDAFYARWPGSYVEDRLRNDWLLELGHRRDWKTFQLNHPAYQMRDDREVLCYAMLADHVAGKPVAREARAAWLAQREADEGCQALAGALFEARKLSAADVWLKMRLAAEAQKPATVKAAASLLGKPVEQAVAEIQDKAGKYLARKARAGNPRDDGLSTLALMRVALTDPDQARALLKDRWEKQLPAELAAWVWIQAARQSAMRLQPEANDDFEHAIQLQGQPAPEWSDDTLAWMARAALRAGRWPQLLQALDMMSPAEQAQPQWQYWRAHALPDAQGRPLLQTLAANPAAALNFYGRLAAEDLQQPLALPAPPPPLSPAERQQAQNQAGVQRALLLIAYGLRSEGLREWNFSMRGASDRELRAYAQEACDRQVWDRCISASDRTQREIDIAQRFPLPYRSELLAATQAAGVDPAYAYGLIRQESRFVFESRSHVGAAGLMQVMPSTAKWVAKKQGIPFKPETLYDTDVNLRIGAGYLKLVLDRFKGSLPLAAAAYNAGPSRPLRWREGGTLDAAVWAETIPFWETRDYVKKVLVNTVVYTQLLGGNALSLRAHLGQTIGPAEPDSDIPAPNPNKETP
jgi:soluble lytic murein transglycosylase